MSCFTRYWGKFSYLLETRLCKRFDKYHVCLYTACTKLFAYESQPLSKVVTVLLALIVN